MRKHIASFVVLCAGVVLFACGANSSSSGPACSDASDGGTCLQATDCMFVACKCADGSGSDKALVRACFNGMCSGKDDCSTGCQSHGGVAVFKACVSRD